MLILSPAADEVAAGADEVRVVVVAARVLVVAARVVVLVVTGRVEVVRLRAVEVVAVVGAALDATALEDDGLDEPGHLPNRGLQPVSQWSGVLPHHPYWEQHSPSEKPVHVNPLAAPHEPSVETTRPLGAEVGADAEEDAWVDAG